MTSRKITRREMLSLTGTAAMGGLLVACGAQATGDALREGGVPAETGVFQAKMQVHLVNEGPVTVIVET